MIKHINRQNILTTPFTAVKQWEFYNVQNDELVLLEPLSASVPIPDTYVAVDYIDYVGTPILNRECNIALEQQDTDQAIYEVGISGSGKFYNTSSEDTNTSTGTSKRLLYNQISKAFYNQYRNPLELFGMENIDIPLSGINRHLTSQFLMFTIPQNIMGDRLVENSVAFYDTSLDDNMQIHDDGEGNLHAGNNLFSKIQEVRPFDNLLLPGSSSFVCAAYSSSNPVLSPVNLLVTSGSSILTWDAGSDNQTGFIVEKSTNSYQYFKLITTNATTFTYTDTNVTIPNTYWYRVKAFNNYLISDYSNIANITFL